MEETAVIDHSAMVEEFLCSFSTDNLKSLPSKKMNSQFENSQFQKSTSDGVHEFEVISLSSGKAKFQPHLVAMHK